MRGFPSHKKQGIEPAVDVTLRILEAASAARPKSTFLASLLQQYRERGGLSKKQLEGLHSKASKIEDMSQAHLATLQAIINKKQTRHGTGPQSTAAIPAPDESAAMITAILDRYPHHKRVLFFQVKIQNAEALTALEKEELKKFHKLLTKD